MRLGLLGDIHGNIDALSAVLAKAYEMEIQALLITGDLVGYYFYPARVLEALKGWPTYIVRGNHEEMLIAARGDEKLLSSIERKYGSGIKIALNELSVTELDKLCKLPHPLNLRMGDCKILLCHGSPLRVDQYIYPDVERSTLESLDPKNFDFVVMGHTHYQMMREVGGAMFINPGSVGQPRDGRPGAQWAILDTVSREVDFRVEVYDQINLIRECNELHPELPYLASILERSK